MGIFDKIRKKNVADMSLAEKAEYYLNKANEQEIEDALAPSTGIYTVVRIDTGLTLTERNMPKLSEIIDKVNATIFDGLSPYGFIFYFENGEPKEQVGQFVEGIKNLIRKDKEFSEFRVGVAHGEVQMNIDPSQSESGSGPTFDESKANLQGKEDL